MPAPQRTPLEPLAAPVLAVALAHVLVGILIWTFLPFLTNSQKRSARAEMVWMSPADFIAPSPPPAAPKSVPKKAPAAPARPTPPAAAAVVKPAPASPPPQASPPAPVALAQPTPLRATNKYITLSPRVAEIEGPPAPPKPYRPVPSLLDIAISGGEVKRRYDGTGMGAVDEAIQQTYLKEWVAPSTHLVPPGQRSAVLNLSISKDGTVVEAIIIKTGAPALNVSVSEAIRRVTKIPVSLPSSFRKPRYDLQVNFQIE